MNRCSAGETSTARPGPRAVCFLHSSAQVRVRGVATDESLDKGAHRHHALAPGPDEVKGFSDQARPDAASGQSRGTSA